MADAWRTALTGVLTPTDLAAQIREAWQKRAVLPVPRHPGRHLDPRSLRGCLAPLQPGARRDRRPGWRAPCDSSTRRSTCPHGAGQPVLVWNTLPWERTEPVRIVIPMGGWRADFQGTRYPGAPTITDAQGRHAIPCQIVEVELDNNTYMVHIEALVTVPALGARCCTWRSRRASRPPRAAAVTTAGTSISRRRSITACSACAWTRGPARSLSICGRPRPQQRVPGRAGQRAAGDRRPQRHLEPRRGVVPRRAGQLCRGGRNCCGQGPIRQTVRVRSAWCGSTIVQDISLVAGEPYIDVTMTVDWREQLKMLKLAFPLQLHDGRGDGLRALWLDRQREPNGEEEPCQSWIDLTGPVRPRPGRRGWR